MPRRRSTVAGMVLVASLLLGGPAHRAPADHPPPVGGVEPSRAPTEHKFLALRDRIRHIRLGQRTTAKGVLRTLGVQRTGSPSIILTGGFTFYFYPLDWPPRPGPYHRLTILLSLGRLESVELTGE
jgi:hypothetical protein